MIKKLIRQEVFKRDASPIPINIQGDEPSDAMTPRSYEGGSSDGGGEEAIQRRDSIYDVDVTKKDNVL